MDQSLAVAFAGTPDFALPALDAIAASRHRLAVIYTQPDRPAGRGRRLSASTIKERGLALGLPIEQPATLRDPGAAATLAAHAPDVMVVVAYGLLLPQAVLAVPRLGCLNIHASLLPRWRGAAPIARAIEAGDTTTGITIMQMEAGLDTGPMLLSSAVPIGPDDTAATLTATLAALGARLIVEALAGGESLVATPQPDGATYASKIDKAEAWVDWTQGSEVLARRVRAFDPFPVASTVLHGTPIRLWRAAPETGGAALPPGTVVGADASGVTIACGRGLLRVTELQRPGGKRLPAREFLAGFPVRAGERCGSAPAA